MLNDDLDIESPLEDLDTILVDETALKSRLHELGRQISADYKGQEIAVIAIINGAVIFVADLIRQINLPLQLDCVRVSSYHDEAKPVRTPEIIDRIRLDLQDVHVLLIDDILDTGNTLSKIVEVIRKMGPASLKTCVLLDKQTPRKVDFEADYVGFVVPDEFVVGYGLDFAERYRQLPCIGVLKPELQNPPEWG
ncbi:hypoxanthine phosphoribosyltransferase [Coraliomargarita parva]|uniref:hypoxanthine phosphoribosyltransferase n=1 Tax=Coraliomargarita parva TaxID=3014050 RepID=UPI0022B4C21F|nr:hypoxanthine phosphoribosyltransferase [Coraliomargarita parva]